MLDKRIIHLTSAHDRYDVRIFIKMCCSLASEGFNISLIVADGLGDEIKNGVYIYDVGVTKNGRVARMTKTVSKIYDKALSLNGDIFHLHDPELLQICLKLKKHGKKVIFDAHEDLPKQILGKSYLNIFSKLFLSKVLSMYESFICKRIDGVIAATPFIRDKFFLINLNTIDINNYPIMGELSFNSIDWTIKKQHVAYVGGIGRIRGILQLVDALNLTTHKARLQLAGIFGELDVKQSAKSRDGWQHVDELGNISRHKVRDLLGYSVAGIVTFLPLPNHIDAQPNKMFEYMSAGIPVIGSNFPLWKEIIEGNNCGLCVDPLEPSDIAAAIDYLIENPDKAELMGRNGQLAIREKYNWDIEKQKLFNFYILIEDKQND